MEKIKEKTVKIAHNWPMPRNVTLIDMQNEMLYGELGSIFGEENVICTSQRRADGSVVDCYGVNLSRAGGWVDPRIQRYHQEMITVEQLLEQMNGPLPEKPFRYEKDVNTFLRHALVIDFDQKDNEALLKHLATIPCARAPQRPRHLPPPLADDVGITK